MDKNIRPGVVSSYEEYISEHADVRSWMKEYRLSKIRPFEPLVRNYEAIKYGGEMARFFGKDKS